MNEEIPGVRVDYLARVHTKVTAKFKKRLRWACEKRRRETARQVPEGEILSEMAELLEAHPDEIQPNGARRQKTAKRKRAAKRTMTAEG